MDSLPLVVLYVTSSWLALPLHDTSPRPRTDYTISSRSDLIAGHRVCLCLCLLPNLTACMQRDMWCTWVDINSACDSSNRCICLY